MIVDLQNAWNDPQYEARHVRTFAEAASAVRSYIEAHDLTAGCGSGGNDFTGGSVFAGGVKVGHVSYNGRVWGMDGKEILA